MHGFTRSRYDFFLCRRKLDETEFHKVVRQVLVKRGLFGTTDFPSKKPDKTIGKCRRNNKKNPNEIKVREMSF